jgi:hypothetical protein
MFISWLHLDCQLPIADFQFPDFGFLNSQSAIGNWQLAMILGLLKQLGTF